MSPIIAIFAVTDVSEGR